MLSLSSLLLNNPPFPFFLTSSFRFTCPSSQNLLTRSNVYTIHQLFRSSHSQPSSSLPSQRSSTIIQLSNSNQSPPPSIISNHINPNSIPPISLSVSESQPLQINPKPKETSINHSIIIQSSLHPSSQTTPPSLDHHPSQHASSNPSNPINLSASQSPPTTRSNQRPKKQVITLTPKAIQHLSSLLDGPVPRLIRIGVKNKGCAGMAYNLEYVEKPGKFDEVVTTQNQQGKEVKILIDSRALFSIIGSTMDWQETKLGNKFVFDNPNIKEECGCGESFLV